MRVTDWSVGMLSDRLRMDVPDTCDVQDMSFSVQLFSFVVCVRFAIGPGVVLMTRYAPAPH